MPVTPEIINLVDSKILKHENEAAKRINTVVKEEQKIRHDNINKQDTYNKYQDDKIEKNEKNIALHNQGLEFMNKKVEQIETHLKEGISEIKDIIKEQAETFATKAEHKENSLKINWVIKVIWTFGVAIILGGGAFIWNFIINR